LIAQANMDSEVATTNMIKSPLSVAVAFGPSSNGPTIIMQIAEAFRHPIQRRWLK